MPTVPTRLARRSLLRAFGAAGVAALVGCAEPRRPAPAATGPARLRLLAETTLPHRMAFQGTTVGGLSGLDFDPATGEWVAISDDRSELQPARFYRLDVALAGRSLRVAVRASVTLRLPDGQPFPPRRAGGEVADPEAIRLLPQGRGLLWTSEGDARVNQPAGLYQSAPDGRVTRRFDLPRHLGFDRPGHGARDNDTLEGLALTPDARVAWVAMEGPLQQDGPPPRVGSPGGACRITAFDTATGAPLRQFAYLPEAVPVAPAVPGTYASNGISEILMVDATRMLVLERAYALGTGNALRLYEVDTRAGSDTLRLDQLAPGAFTPPAKRLVADFAQSGLERLDNTEGLCWGPRLASGARTLFCVSDDNFNPAQATQFAAFEYLE